MIRSRSVPRHAMCLSIAIVLLAIPHALARSAVADPPAAADSPADPGEDLAEELAKAKARIAELEAEVAALRAQVASGPAAPPKLPVQTDPFESPGSIRSALEADYTKALAEALPAPGDAAAAALFRRELERWVASVNRTFRQAVRWNARLLKAEPQGERLLVTLVPVDPESGISLGEEYTASLDPRIARRLPAAARNRPDGEAWVVTGTFVPEIRFRPERMERGIFDNPPLLGPGAEFLWRIEVESMVPARRGKPGEPTETPTR